MHPAKNVFGEPLETCSDEPMTGFFRDGCCNTSNEDVGRHTVCTRVTREFLELSRSRATTCRRRAKSSAFPACVPATSGVLCAARWQEALEAGAAPRVVLRATHAATLEIVELSDLKRYAVDLS